MQHIEFPYAIDPTGQGFFWPESDQKRRDYFAIKALRPAEAEAVYQCRPGARVGSIFVEADFRYYAAPQSLELGRQSPEIRAFLERGAMVAQGWDTAMSAESTADFTVCVTCLLVPCERYHRDNLEEVLGPCDPHYDVYLLDVFRERMDIGDIVAAMRHQALKWEPSRIVVEKKASGTPAMQALANSGLPLEGVSANENKRERAVTGGAGAGSVQGWFRAGRVLFPQFSDGSGPDWLAPFIRELKDFTGEKGGRDDQVDAMVHVIGWAIREGGAVVRFATGWQSPEEVDVQSRQIEKPAFENIPENADVTQILAMNLAQDPFGATCGRCVNFKDKRRCSVRNCLVSSIYPACEHFDDGARVSQFPAF